MRNAVINVYGEIVWPFMEVELRSALKREGMGHYDKFLNAHVSWPTSAEQVEKIQAFAVQAGVRIKSNKRFDISRPDELVESYLMKRFIMSSSKVPVVDYQMATREIPSTSIIAGMEYALRTQRCFLSDPSENDRRLIALLAIHQAHSYPCIIIHRNSDEKIWRKLIQKYFAADFEILDITDVNHQTQPKSIWLVDYHKLEQKDFQLPANKQHWSVIVDHAHLFRNTQTNRYNNLARLCWRVNYCFLLTEFQVNRSEMDLWGLLGILKRQNDFLEFREALYGYLESQISAIYPQIQKNKVAPALDALYFALRSSCLLRRGKDSDLKVQERPQTIPLWSLPNEFQFSYIPSTRRWLGLRKVQGTIEWLKKEFEGGGSKFLVVTHHNDISEAIAKQLDCGIIYGKMRDTKQREKLTKEFMNPDGPRILIIAKDVTLPWQDLYFVDRVVFVEPPQTPLQVEDILGPIISAQAEPNLQVDYLLAEHALDRAAMKRLDLRKRFSKSILDGDKP